MKKALLIVCISILTACTPNKTVNHYTNTSIHNANEDLVEYLEQNLAWTIDENGVAFCAYESLGKEESTEYLQVLCQEFAVRTQKIICPDMDSREACFLSEYPERKGCHELCKFEDVEAYLVDLSGISIPVKITKTNDSYEMWQPRDGSLYMKDLEEHFSTEIYKKLENVDQGFLQEINIKRAEALFNTKAKFNVAGEMAQSCEEYSDCGMLPMEYAIISSCPHTVKCLENQCVAGCYDFFDYTKFPVVEDSF